VDRTTLPADALGHWSGHQPADRWRRWNATAGLDTQRQSRTREVLPDKGVIPKRNVSQR